MIIFLYGEDEFRSREKLAEIKNKFLEKNPDATSGLFDFAEKEWNIDEIVMSISSGELFSSKKLAIVKNLFSTKKPARNASHSDAGGNLESLEKFLKNEAKKEKSDLILVFWESGKVKKSEKFFKLLQKVAKCQEFEILEGSKLKSWISGQVGKIGEDKVSIGPMAVDKLIIFVGNDLNLLSREIEKLTNFKNKGEIKNEDVDLLVKSKIDTDIFKTVDALARGDKKTALKLLHDHIESGEDPFYLLSMYFYQFRNLVKVKPLAEKNESPSDIASKLKMHPFVVRKSLDQVRNFSWLKLKAMYNQLSEIDFESKTGKTDIVLALDKFVAGI